MQKRVSHKNKGKLVVIVLTLVLALGVAGISAYFTDADTATNEFTIGDISLDLQEPGWDPTPDDDIDDDKIPNDEDDDIDGDNIPNDEDDDKDGDDIPDDKDPYVPGEPGKDVPSDPDDVTPGETITKDPQILNDGKNDMYVFLKVEMPYAELVTANPDGTKNDAAWMEMFTYEINEGWVAVGAPVIDQEAGISTQVYAYAVDDMLTALAVEDKTPALFYSVTFQNVIEDQGLEGTVENIVITAYGIQTNNVNGGKTDPAGVWEVIVNQAPVVDGAK